jgi:hypothetical protein
VTADADEEEHAREDDRRPDVVVVRMLGGLLAVGVAALGGCVELDRLVLADELVPRNVGGAGRGVRVRERMGRHPDVEGDLVGGAEPALRDEAACLPPEMYAANQALKVVESPTLSVKASW